MKRVRIHVVQNPDLHLFTPGTASASIGTSKASEEGFTIRAANRKIVARLIVAKYRDRYSWARIAAANGVPDRTARWQHEKALDRLGEALEEVPMADELLGRASRARARLRSISFRFCGPLTDGFCAANGDRADRRWTLEENGNF